MSKKNSIYVEHHINVPLTTLWDYTQQPHLHEQWDLRFTSINYLPKEHESDKQHFTYETNIGFGVKIAGTGISQGERENERGERVSSLSFASDQQLSLINKGSGYWKYTPQEEGIQFETLYNYDVRFGKLGMWFDSFVFRPMIGWATAWSFDCLKKWVEDGIRPLDSIRRSLIHVLLCAVMAFIWIYQGLVPKWLYPQTGEIALLQNHALFTDSAEQMVFVAGGVQILIGLSFLLNIRKKWLFLGSAIAMLPLGIGALMLDSSLAAGPFNPVVLNIAMIGLGFLGWINSKDLVLARNCKRMRSNKA